MFLTQWVSNLYPVVQPNTRAHGLPAGCNQIGLLHEQWRSLFWVFLRSGKQNMLRFKKCLWLRFIGWIGCLCQCAYSANSAIGLLEPLVSLLPTSHDEEKSNYNQTLVKIPLSTEKKRPNNKAKATNQKWATSECGLSKLYHIVCIP